MLTNERIILTCNLCLLFWMKRTELVEALNSAATRSEAERTEDARGAEKRLSVALEAERRDHATKLSTARQESAAALRVARKTAASAMEIAVTNATQV